MGSSFRGVTILCDQCRTPVLRLVCNLLVIHTTHHSERHTTFLDLDALVRLAAGERSEELQRQVRYCDAIGSETNGIWS